MSIAAQLASAGAGAQGPFGASLDLATRYVSICGDQIDDRHTSALHWRGVRLPRPCDPMRDGPRRIAALSTPAPKKQRLNDRTCLHCKEAAGSASRCLISKRPDREGDRQSLGRRRTRTAPIAHSDTARSGRTGGANIQAKSYGTHNNPTSFRCRATRNCLRSRTVIAATGDAGQAHLSWGCMNTAKGTSCSSCRECTQRSRAARAALRARARSYSNFQACFIATPSSRRNADDVVATAAC